MNRFLRLLRYGLPYWFQWLPGVLLLALVGALDTFRVLLFQPIFDQVLRPDAPEGPIAIGLPRSQWHFDLRLLVPHFMHMHNAWSVVAFALIVATVLKGLCDYTGTYLVNYAGFGTITDLRNHLYETTLRRSASFFHKHATGTILSTLINDVDRVQVALSSVISDFLQQFFTFVVGLAFVIRLGGHLSWALLLFVPVVATSARRIGRAVRVRTRTGQDKLAEIQNILHETITGNRIVKAFSMELWETMRFKAAAKRLFSANMRYVVAMAVSSPLMDLLGAVAVALLLKLCSDSISHGTMKVGQFMTFITATILLYQPVRKFSTFYNSFQQAMGASESVFTFMDAKDEVREKALARKLPAFHDSIRFEDVRFHYSDDVECREVLSGINLEVKAGELLAIVGGSGAGKSTLVHLIPRFFDVTGGRILVDGNDIREVSLASLRGQIGIVAQETMLFNDTVRNNIAYGQPHVSQDEVERAANAALAHEFILRMPNGYDTVIGERGYRLSGGERQRLSIARALLKNAPVLILDEATSALDSESEALVQAALQNLMADRTVFVIAHRLSTVRRADRIIVLEDGSIADIGTHEELMSRLGTYRRLHDLQFVDADAPRAAVQEEGGN